MKFKQIAVIIYNKSQQRLGLKDETDFKGFEMSKQKGFTLIELLVVIAIIALLLAILMPSLKMAKEKAAQIVCMTNLNNLGKAWYAYTTDNDSEIVTAWTDQENEDDGVVEDLYSNWVIQPLTNTGDKVKPGTLEQKINGIKAGALYPYLKNHKVYHCRSDKRSKRNPNKAYRSYSIASCMNGHHWPYDPPERTVFKKITQIRSTDSKYVFVEEAETSKGYNHNSWSIFFDTELWIDPVAIWHKDRSTFAFADGHAENNKWLGTDTIDFFEKGKSEGKGVSPTTDKGFEDIRYMIRGYAKKR